MKTPACLSAAVVACASLTAQAVTVSFEAATPVTTTSTIGGSTTTETLPVGPLPAIGDVRALTATPEGVADVSVGWHTLTSPTYDSSIRVLYSVAGAITSQGAATGQIGLHELHLQLTATATRSVRLVPTIQTAVTPGQPAPLLEVDIGGDGSVEFSSATPGIGSTPIVTVGPQPLTVVLRGQGQATASGSPVTFSSGLTMWIYPENDLTVVPTVPSCTGARISAEESFASGGIRVVPEGLLPTFLVVGSAVQPQLLPSSFGSCVLWSTPDVIVLALPSGLDIEVPAALRPINFWVQGLYVNPGLDLSTSNGYRIYAQ